MRFRIVTVVILLAVASRGYGRPRDPDPLDSSAQEVTGATLGAAYANGSPDSRYMVTIARQAASTSFKTNRRGDISINSFKYGNNSNKSVAWLGRSLFTGLSFDNSGKNYLPLGALSSVGPRNDVRIKPESRNRQSFARRIDSYNPLTIPFISSHISIPIPIPVSIRPSNEIVTLNSTRREDKPLPSLMRSTPQPIPIFVPQKSYDDTSNVTFRGERKLGARTLVRIVPQSLKPGYNVRKNSTRFKVKPQLSNVHLKNWPNEALQNVQDLFNYEKYTTFNDDDKDNNKLSVDVLKAPNRIDVLKTPNREPLIKSPESISPVRWSKIPVVEVTTLSNDIVDIDTTMKIDNLLDDLGGNKILSLPQTSSEVAQNTVVHILNAGSRKPNVTVGKPVNANKINKTKTGSTRPPQNVHIMFMMNKDESNNTVQQKPPTEILGNGADCPTIMINSITQINNTIESKEGCTDLNIVINSHVLNTHIFKPSPTASNSLQSSTEASKDPYASSPENSNDPSNYGNNNYYQNKDPNSQAQSDEPGLSRPVQPESAISTFQVFQGTHINIGGGGISGSSDVNSGIENTGTGTSGSDDVTGTDADGAPLPGSEEEASDVTGTNPEEAVGDNTVGSAADAGPSGPASEGVQSTVTGSVPGDIGSGQANDAAPVSLPSLPNIPNLPSLPNQLSNLASNTGSGGPEGPGQTGVAPLVDDDEDEDDLEEALSPVGLLESITSVFTYVSDLNPINYGIFGMAVAPFVAFAAGIVGVAAFLFPWAFPGSLDVGRKWDTPNYGIKYKYHPNLPDVVHSSIHKYRHINEWKGRRRKKKRKR